MEGLQRSSSTFRRSGSSGLVWDERFLTDDAEAKDGGEEALPDLRRSRSAGGVGMMMRRAAAGEDKAAAAKKKKKKKQEEEERHDQQVFRTKDVAPDLDPPSPRVSGCILCAVFRGGSASSPATAAAARRNRTKPKTKKQR